MKKWKIIYWLSDKIGEPEQLLFIKENDVEEVVKFCKMKGLKDFCIFDDDGINVYTFSNNIGQFNTVSKFRRDLAIKNKKEEKK